MALAEFPLQVVVRAIDQITAPLKRIQGRIDDTFAPIRKVRGAFAQLVSTSGLGKLSSAVGEVGSRLGDVGREAVAFGAKLGGIAAAAGGALYAIVNGFAKAGDAAYTASQKIGVPVEALQELRYAAEQNGVEVQALDNGLTQLARRLGLVAQGNKGAAVGFERLGVNVFGADGKLRDLAELLPELADRFGQVDDAGKRVALAQQLFGKSGADLIPLLRAGGAEIRANAREARELGLVLSEDAARAGKAFGDEQTRLMGALAGVRNVIGAELLPIVGDLVRQLTAFIVENRPLIAAWAREFAAGLPERLRQVRDFFVELREKLEPLIAVAAFFVEHFGAVNTILGVLAVVLGAKLIVAIVSLIPAVYALGTAILTTPIGWILAGIAAVIAIGVLLYKHWDSIAAFFVGLWTTVRDAFVAGFGWVWEHVPWVLGPVALIIKYWGPIREFFGALWTWVVGRFSQAWEFVKRWWPLFLGPVGIIIAQWTRIRTFFGDLWDWLRDLFNTGLRFLVDQVRSIVDLLPDWLKDRLGLTINAPAPRAAVPLGAAATPAGSSTIKSEATVRVDFSNVPKGTRVEQEGAKGTEVDLSLGYAMGSP